MKKVFDYKQFINEGKKEKLHIGLTEKEEIEKEVKSILKDMFATTKRVSYKYDENDIPVSVKFEVEKEDYFIDYDEDLETERTPGVEMKRSYDVVLKANPTKEIIDAEGQIYFLEFEIQSTPKDMSKFDEYKRSKEEKVIRKIENEMDDEDFDDEDDDEDFDEGNLEDVEERE